MELINLIISITKFSIAIGSLRAYLYSNSKLARDHVGVQLPVSDLNFL